MIAEDTRSLLDRKIVFQLIKISETGKGAFDEDNRINLTRRKMFIGNNSNADVHVDDKKVEERHAFLRVQRDKVFVVDLDSTLGTKVNKKKITLRRELKHMDQIQVGNGRFLFIDPTYPLDPAVLEDYFDESLPEVHRDFEFKLKTDDLFKAEKEKMDKDKAYLPSINEFMRIVSEIASGYSLPVLLDRILGFIFSQFPADRGFILLYDPEDDQFVPMATRSRIKDLGRSRLAISRSLLKQVWQEREALLIQDISSIGDGVKSASMILHKFTSVMIAPLIYNREFLGALQIDAMQGGKCFKREHLQKILAYCHAAAIAIANTRMRDQLKEEEAIRMSLSRYLPNKLIEQVAEGRTIPTGGVESEVAVMFVDIRGFTTMCEKLSPHDVSDLLNEFYEQASEIIFEYSGMITQYVGDSIICIFGGPWISEPSYNPCDAAVQAAREIIGRLVKTNKERIKFNKDAILVGIGIDYGKVVIGNIGTSKKFEFTAIGLCVNRSSRLCAIAKPSHILVSDSVLENLQGGYSYQPMPPVKVKNIQEPVEVYRFYWNK